MEAYRRSEIARLVLGYLEVSCLKSWGTFFVKCADLKEYRRKYRKEKKCSTNVDGKSLTDILQEYRKLQCVQNNAGNVDNSSQRPTEDLSVPRKSPGNSAWYNQRRALPTPSLVSPTSTPSTSARILPRQVEGHKMSSSNSQRNAKRSKPSLNKSSRTSPSAEVIEDSPYSHHRGSHSRTSSSNQSPSLYSMVRETVNSTRIIMQLLLGPELEHSTGTAVSQEYLNSQNSTEISIENLATNLTRSSIVSDSNDLMEEEDASNRSQHLALNETLSSSCANHTDVTPMENSMTSSHENLSSRVPNTNSPPLELSLDQSHHDSFTPLREDKRPLHEVFSTPKQKDFVPIPDNLKHSVSSDLLHDPVDDTDVLYLNPSNSLSTKSTPSTPDRIQPQHVEGNQVSSPNSPRNAKKLSGVLELKESQAKIKEQDIQVIPTEPMELSSLHQPISAEDVLIASSVKTVNNSRRSTFLDNSSQNNENSMHTASFSGTMSEKELISYPKTLTSCKNSFLVGKLDSNENVSSLNEKTPFDKKNPRKKKLFDNTINEKASNSLEKGTILPPVASTSCTKSVSKKKDSYSQLKEAFFHSSDTNAEKSIGTTKITKSPSYQQSTAQKEKIDRQKQSEQSRSNRSHSYPQSTPKKVKKGRQEQSDQLKANKSHGYHLSRTKKIKNERQKQSEQSRSNKSRSHHSAESLSEAISISSGRLHSRSEYGKDNDVVKRFARLVVGKEKGKVFDDFLSFLIHNEKGKKCFEVITREGKYLHNVSSILNGTGRKSKAAFIDLYDIWFDEEGNKSRYLSVLENKGINLSNISSILNGAGANAKDAFQALYDLWFDEKGNKPQYLKVLEKEQIKLRNISSILNGAGANASEAFKALYDLWFDEKGNKKPCLKNLEKENINLSNVSSILNGSGAYAKKAFENLYNLWFNNKGKKERFLTNLKKNKVDLVRMSSILSGSGIKGAIAFRELHDLWFDKEGNKTRYLRTLEKEGINVSKISNILNKAGANGPKTFEALCSLWFEADGSKKQKLKNLEENELNLVQVCNILKGSGAKAVDTFKKLYSCWFDDQGDKSMHLKSLEKLGMKLPQISDHLKGKGAEAPKCFKDLCSLWDIDKTQNYQN